MARSTRALAGAAKDAYLARLVGSVDGLDETVRAELTGRLTQEIALVSLKRHAAKFAQRQRSAEAEGGTLVATDIVEIADVSCADATAAVSPPEPTFDPYSPNVIVVIRTRGREAVLEELHSIDDVECLRILAREQQLGIAADLADAAELRLAIVAAAERRIANRRAAAS